MKRLVLANSICSVLLFISFLFEIQKFIYICLCGRPVLIETVAVVSSAPEVIYID